MGFSALSVEDGLRAGGLGLRTATVAGAGSCLGVTWPDVAGREFILLSDLIASLVENIRVSRFVIEGFSEAGARGTFCGSVGGAACPFARFSELGTAMPFCLTGRELGELTTEDVCDAAGEGWAFSAIRESLGVLTVAMVIVVGGRGVALGNGMRRGGRQRGAGNARILVEFWRTKLLVQAQLSGRGGRVFLGGLRRVCEDCRGGRF